MLGAGRPAGPALPSSRCRPGPSRLFIAGGGGGGSGADGGGGAAAAALGGAGAAGGVRGLPGHGSRRAAGSGAAGRGAGGPEPPPGVLEAAGQPLVPAGARPEAAHGGEPRRGGGAELSTRWGCGAGAATRPGRERGGSGTNRASSPRVTSGKKITKLPKLFPRVRVRAHIICPEEAAHSVGAFRGQPRRAPPAALPGLRPPALPADREMLLFAAVPSCGVRGL